ncbi:SAM-dependent methyltransferase, partial [Brevundimonas sp.]|uniref:SAM-dependent methyltransferase n=1 Tax=Brevundimonas sp. TaxID=1871086 RepID=UPI002AB95120
MSDAETLKTRLAREIALTGPTTVADYVTRCLHDPKGGYYASRPALGEGGDFITAPLVSQMFGELIGLWAVETWNRLGAPERFRLVEVGPGDGTLMSDALRAARLVPGFLEACDLILIEPSAPLRDLQAKALAGADLSPRWVRDLTRIETDAPVILIANEVLDCLPARQFVRTDGGWAERRIGVTDDNDLIFGLTAISGGFEKPA